MTLRIHLLGAGAIGGLFAARLSHFADVRLLVRTSDENALAPVDIAHTSDSNTDSRRQNLKLQLQDDKGTHLYRLPCDSIPDSTTIDYLLLTTKSYDAVSALQSVRHRLTASSKIFLFQNGLGSQSALLTQFPELNFFGATTTEGANRTSSHDHASSIDIVHAGKGKTWIGSLIKGRDDQISECKVFAAALQHAGFNTGISEDIWEHLWKKLTINCGINAYTALLNCKNGQILDKPLFQSTIDPLAAELETVLEVAGYPENREHIKQRIIDVAIATGENISSMLQDIRHHKATEILAINGFICDFARRHQLDYRVNNELTQQVLALHPESRAG